MEEEKLNLILEKIEKLEKKVNDNNSILHSERNSKRWAKLFWIIKWIVITALGIVAWSYIQPIYQSITETYNNIAETSAQAKKTLDKIPSTEDFSLDSLKNKFLK